MPHVCTSESQHPCASRHHTHPVAQQLLQRLVASASTKINNAACDSFHIARTISSSLPEAVLQSKHRAFAQVVNGVYGLHATIPKWMFNASVPSLPDGRYMPSVMRGTSVPMSELLNMTEAMGAAATA